MAVTSAAFVLFVLTIALVYYILPHRAQNVFLLAASLLFLASFDLSFPFVFVALTACNYWLALRIVRRDTGGRWLLRVGVVINVLSLACLKYPRFFLPAVDAFANGIGLRHTGEVSLLFPIGLSFFVVQAIAYLLDVSNGTVLPTTNPITFGLFMLYFPRMVSGPIEWARDLIPHLEAQRIVDNAALSRGIVLVINGLIRKIVLADTLFFVLPGDVFSAPDHYSAPALTGWLLVYGFALYNDFAGYTSIVRGVSSFFGIELARNFNAPYLARNFTEFWQRWHITFSAWLRFCVFLPSTRSLLRRHLRSTHWALLLIPPLLTMFVSALWHQASWHMLVWGLLHGLYLVGERLYRLKRPPRPGHQPHWTGAVVVFSLTMLAWVPFRAALPDALVYWRGLASLGEWVTHGADILHVGAITGVLLVVVTLLLDKSTHTHGEFGLLQRSALAQAAVINAVVFALLIALAIQGGAAPPPFVYQGF
jgi:alginate O-acetyltransferase complex protein AlgI